MSTITYNHALDIAFEVVTKDKEGEDIQGVVLRNALQKRLDSLSDEELEEACGAPFDTYNVED